MTPFDVRQALAEIERRAEERRTPWRPLPGPQAEAYASPADVLLYGGAAGGGP
jgi:hypothetical protein